MIPRTRFRRDLLVRFGWIILAAAVAVAGCSTANTPGGGGSVNHITAQGTSVSGWLTASGPSSHSRSATTSFIALGNAGGCTECHGADLLGGISRVSCMSNPSACHHTPIANWVVSPAGAATQQHGASAKRAPGSSSMYACQICHGKDFAGTAFAPTCLNNAACHGAGVASPHPSKWLNSTGGISNHNSTNTANAPVCYGCHAYAVTPNPNNPAIPTSPAAAGTAPGCYNGTMCHNAAAAPHAIPWEAVAPGFHGTTAKADLTYCQGCHGTPGTIRFDGGSAPTACSASVCHPDAKAHPTDWQGNRLINGVTITHRTSQNRDVACAICHNVIDNTASVSNPSAPSCFSRNFASPGQPAPRACHPGGPGTAPHALDNTWSDPAVGGSAFHGTEAKADLLVCQTCHGTPPRSFAGGPGATTACTTCHTTAEAHPTDWQAVRVIFTASISHRTSGNRDVACAICHKTTGAGAGPNPSAPSCFSTVYTNGDNQARSCHSNGPGQASHAVPFIDNTAHTRATTGTFDTDCAGCHDTSNPSTKSGPVCTTCHISNPLGVTNCTSCHANPPSGATTAFPNVAGAHAKHLALDNTSSPVSCATCHTGLGTGTLSHYNRTRPPRVPPASVAFVATIYNAKTGAPAFDNSSLLRCTNVSCHGGQAAPNWQTGTIASNTQCTSCHASGTAQFNSYNSGEHSLHVGSERFACTECHDLNYATNPKPGVSNHFKYLSTFAMEGPAKDTFRNSTGTVVYTPGATAGTGKCSGSCHGTNHSNWSW